MTPQAGFNYVAVGEGEQVIIDAVRALLNDRPLNEVKGIASGNAISKQRSVLHNCATIAQADD